MKITVLCVGKVKESFYRDAIAEYSKRLGRYCRLYITEVADEPAPENAPAAIIDRIKSAEGERLMAKIRPDMYVIALDIHGTRMSSEALAGKLDSLALSGSSDIAFVIGGSLGLSDAVLGRADLRLSFSDFTFPHQLMRVILLEQIYRSFKIMRGEPYHK